MSNEESGFDRRKVLKNVGAATVGGVLMTGTVSGASKSAESGIQIATVDVTKETKSKPSFDSYVVKRITNEPVNVSERKKEEIAHVRGVIQEANSKSELRKELESYGSETVEAALKSGVVTAEYKSRAGRERNLGGDEYLSTDFSTSSGFNCYGDTDGGTHEHICWSKVTASYWTMELETTVYYDNDQIHGSCVDVTTTTEGDWSTDAKCVDRCSKKDNDQDDKPERLVTEGRADFSGLFESKSCRHRHTIDINDPDWPSGWGEDEGDAETCADGSVSSCGNC